MEGSQEREQPLLDETTSSPRRHGMRVVFSNLEYFLPSNINRGEMATVLKKMSGYFNPGEMTAVMGPSGCGKSILMDVLAGRRTSGTIHGAIRYDGQTPSQGFLRWCTGYVEQFSSLIENLTVFEMLMYTAELKVTQGWPTLTPCLVQRPLGESFSSKKQAVLDLIDRLALTSCKDSRIGDPHLDRGISGGEGKRVNIGIALITNPRVLYMDEPVSGLDSYTANEVMEVIRGLVFEGTTLCATLHSPTPFTFRLFDSILLLVQGTMVFFGSRDKVVGYFEGIGVRSFHSSQSVAEWLTEIIVKADQEDTTPVLIDGYQRSKLREEAEELALASCTSAELGEEDMQILHEDAYRQKPFWFSLRTLLAYRALKNLMSLSFWLTRSIDKSVIVLLLCTLYRGLGDDFSPYNYLNLSALMFIWTTFSATGALVYVPRLVIERWVFYREQRDGLYPVFSYFLIKIIEESLVAAVLAVLFCCILWFVIDLQGSLVRFVITFYGMFTSSIVLALFFGAVAPNMDIANALFPCYMLTLMFYAGYLLLPQDIPNYLVWYSKLDFLKYCYSALMVNHFASNAQLEGLALFYTPEDYLDSIGLGDVKADWYVVILYLFAASFGFLAYLAMHFVRYERKE